MSDAFPAALRLLRDVTTDDGILASPADVTNYRRVWARDSVMCGMAGLAAADPTVTRGLKRTLDVLAETQGPDGQIASNVALEDGRITDVSYGGLSGRVDALPWFVLGAAHYVHHTGDTDAAERYRPVAERALKLLTAWEYNRRGLVYVPLGGDWADEYVLHGYVLFDQLLRLWALRAARHLSVDPDCTRRADRVAERIAIDYRPRPDGDPDRAYHPPAYRRHREAHGASTYWLASLHPGGYQTPFDAWANALAVLLSIGRPEERTAALDHGEALRAERPGRLIPAFWPPIEKGDSLWPALSANYRDRFSNRPGHYHNGGLWPMVNGWWGLALAAAGREAAARACLQDLYAALRNEAGDYIFPEYRDAHHGAPHGTTPLGWSAAGAVLLQVYLAAPSSAQGALLQVGEGNA